MCGIWSFVTKDKEFTCERIKKIAEKLFILSETRGKEASGIMGLTESKMQVYKAALPGSVLVGTKEFEEYWEKTYSELQEVHLWLGHSRLVTNGSENTKDNNQPVYDKNVVTVHNGIIVNVEELWQEHPELQREHEVDTEIFVKLFEKYLNERNQADCALSKVYSEISGMASTISFLDSQNMLIAATNNGSLYYCTSRDEESILFASESLILCRLIEQCHLEKKFDFHQIKQIEAGQVVFVNLADMKRIHTSISENLQLQGSNRSTRRKIECRILRKRKEKKRLDPINILDENKLLKYEIDVEKVKELRRCTRCVLPETMPFIEFDDEGVCNYCRTYKRLQYKGEKALRGYADRLKKPGGKLDSVVAFSGGRDSSYGLHYFVKELGLKPVAYSYDWGMITDLARRNQSRMCEKLGIELVVVSADIRKKRENIKKNVSAWLKKPDIGMIPLFMAGDKHYFYYANKVKKDFGLDAVLLASNPFEKTYFKSGYCGVKPEILCTGEEKRAMERLPFGSIVKMTEHYATQYITNPSYINRSIWDTVKATFSYYIIPHHYFLLYDYIPWDEKKINEVLINQYDWEVAKDTKSTWRIGDGTAPFYNYVYYLVTGFTENDTLRSNQIREGMLTRDEALKLVYEDNQPRFDSIKWYFDTIGLSMFDALESVLKIQKYY